MTDVLTERNQFSRQHLWIICSLNCSDKQGVVCLESYLYWESGRVSAGTAVGSQGQPLFNHRTKPVTHQTHTHTHRQVSWSCLKQVWTNIFRNIFLFHWHFYHACEPLRCKKIHRWNINKILRSYLRDAAWWCPSWWSPVTGQFSANQQRWSLAGPRPLLARPPSSLQRTFMHSSVWGRGTLWERTTP